MKLTPKQKYALDLLTDNATKIIGYGGGAGGGKSYVGCYMCLLFCTELKGSKWFVGRDSLKDTRESVLFTFRKVSKEINLHNWRYNDNHIYFDNGSEIEFLDLSFYPQKDPLYERFGSKEYTGGWIEEAGSVHPLAFEILKTRINRWYNQEFGLIGKILVTFNPRKNWLEHIFWRPYKDKKELPDTRFIPALWKDNTHLPEEYIENLKNIKDKATRERLLNGNFDYDEDPASLISYESIENIWNNNHINQHHNYYLTADIARFGSDKAIIIAWRGLAIVSYQVFLISNMIQIQMCINAMRSKWNIRASNCIADEDGIGGGVVDNCHIIGFQNGSSPFDPAYFHLKDECGYKLAELINQIYVEADVDEGTKTQIEEELSQLKTYESDKDGKLRILPKVKIKENIGRSPDWLDNFIMRMYYELVNPEQENVAYKKALELFN